MKSKTEKIDGLEVITTSLPARRAYRLAHRLLQMLGPAIAKLDGISEQAELSALAPALQALFSQVSEDQLEDLQTEILASTSVVMTEGKSARRIELDTGEGIDTAFTGRLKTMFKVIAFVVRFNFGDFFAGGARSTPQTPTP